jgi:peroxiredoxin
VSTDAVGFWRCDIIPGKVDDVWIRLSHPDYIDDEVYGTTKKPSMEKLRAMTGAMVMSRGVPVAGRVVNLSGQPIRAAKVAQGSDRFGSHYPSTETDANGRFEFRHTRPGEMVLTVQADGYAPELKEIAVREGTEPVEFQLGAAHTIRGRVLDSEDKPIQGAFVAADTWRGHRSINWRSESDSEGYFEWNGAPADEVLFDIGKQGYMSVRGFAMSSEIDEYVIVLYPPLRVSGAVVDAATNEPIRSFKVVTGIKWDSSDRVHWSRDNARDFTNGRYEHTFTYPYDGHLIRIEAEGYMPSVSRVFYNDEADVVFDFALERGEGPGGTVYLPDGEPAADAEVILCTPSQGAYLQNGRNVHKRDIVFVETGPDGRFSFPAQTEKYLLAVLHDEGYAEITDEELATSGEVTIQPWGRVEGELRIGSEPGAGEGVSLYYERPYEPNTPRLGHNYSSVTDANGYFAFDRLAPGAARVGRHIWTGRYRRYHSHAVPVEVRAGETISVTIGGTGRPVVGRVVVPPDCDEPVDWSRGDSRLGSKDPEKPQPPYPDDFRKMTRKEQVAWYLNWQKTEEGKAFIKKHLLPMYPDNIIEMTEEEIEAWFKNWGKSEAGKAYMKAQQERARQRRSYPVMISSDGTFRVEDVPAGAYGLHISVYEKPRDQRYGYGELIGSLNYEFEVPDVNEGDSDEPLDIGTHEIEIRKRLKVGDFAPSFEAESFDGKKVRPADYNGKVVLLVFWVSRRTEFIKEIPNLNKIYDIFSGDAQFVMVGVSVDPDIEAARKLVKENRLEWTNCFISPEAIAAVAEDYGIQRFPYILVIGRDGRILAKNPKPEQLESTLRDALGME